MSATQRNVLTFSWEEFRILFQQRFQVIASEEVALGKIQRWKQTSNLDAYIRGFLNLSSNITYLLAPEPLRLVTFTNGLKPHIRRYVKTMKPKSVQEAIVFAREGNDTYASDGPVLQHISERQSNHRRQSHGLGDSRVHPIQLDNAEFRIEKPYEETYSDPGLEEWEAGEDIDPSTDSYKLNMLLAALTPEMRQLFKEGRCFHCHQKGHQRNQCRKLQSQEKNLSK